MTTGVRAQRRAELEARLLDVGRQHLARHGAAALSIRAVARDLDLAPSALFRYVSGRDELLTLLIIDSYTSLADTVEAALCDVPARSLARRWQTLAETMRAWALAHPHQWALLYGSPVPDYEAPEELTNEPGTRVPRLMAAIGDDAVTWGKAGPAVVRRRVAGEAIAKRATSGMLGAPDLPAGLTPTALANGLTAWLLLVGAISTEVFEGLGRDAPMPELFAYVVAVGERLMLGE